MVSRMERYYKTERDRKERTKKNADLYRAIYDEAEYTNIESVTTIEKSNEIDIGKIKEMLQNREEYQKRKEIAAIQKPKPVEPKIEYFDTQEDRNFDIRDILMKAKGERSEDEKTRALRNTQYDILKNINLKDHFDKTDYLEDDDEKLKELIHTITNTSVLNKMGDRELSLDLLDLKSSGNTMVETSSAIAELLREAKAEAKEEEKEEIDKSFYTSSLNFGDDDFEELRDIHHSVKKGHRLVKGMITILILLILIAVAFLIYLFFFK